MNIFILDLDKRKSAQCYVDKHAVKQQLELSQLLCTAHHMTDSTWDSVPYRKTHFNHPSAKWVRASKMNYMWACDMGLEICYEYTYRYGKVHKCQGVIEACREHPISVSDIGLTPFVLAMPDEYKTNDPVESYRNYYRGAKQHLFSWKGRQRPDWL